MDDKQLADLLKYSSPKQLYVVTWNNVLKLLTCPFKVLVLEERPWLKKGELVWVQEVKVTRSLKTLYVIQGQTYYYYHFDIIIDDD